MRVRVAWSSPPADPRVDNACSDAAVSTDDDDDESSVLAASAEEEEVAVYKARMLSRASLAWASKAMSLGKTGQPYAGHSPMPAMGGVAEYTPSYVLWLDWRAAYGVS